MVNWGILSTAKIGENAIIPAILQSKFNSLVAIASRNKLKAEKLALQFDAEPIEGYENLLNRDDINAIYIPLPNSMHFEWVTKALNSGKNVLVEKSATVNFEEAEQLVKLAKENGLVLMENFQFQWHSQHQYVLSMLNKGVIGEIRSFRSSFGFPPFSLHDNIRYKPELGGGALLDAGAYTLKASSFILGSDLEVTSSKLVIHPEFNVDWYGGAFLSSKSKDYFSEVSFGFDNYYQCNYEIWGSEGKITSTRAFTAKPGYQPPILVETKSKGTEEIILNEDNHFLNMIEYFAELVIDKNEELHSEELDKILIQSKLIDQVRQRNNS